MANEIAELPKSELVKKYASALSATSRLRREVNNQPAKLAAIHSVAVLGGAASGAVVDHYAPSIMGKAPSVTVGAACAALGWLVLDMPELVVFGSGMLAPHVRDMTALAVVSR